MTCPRCQSALQVATYENVDVDRCAQCQGVWLDQGEIRQIVTTQDEEFTPELVQETLKKALTGVPQAEQDSVELCPKCSTPMNPQNYNYSSGIIVDVCPEGHGLWLDRYELEKVQAHEEHWQAKLEKERPQWNRLAASAAEELEEYRHQQDVRNKAPHGFVWRQFDRLLAKLGKS